jgi:WD40 repeat protein
LVSLCSGIVLRVLFHPKQLLLFSSCDAGEVRVWDLVTKSCVHSLKGGHISAVPALCLSPDGWHLLSGGRDKVACVWDIRDGKRVSTVPVFEGLEGESGIGLMVGGLWMVVKQQGLLMQAEYRVAAQSKYKQWQQPP